MGVTAYSDGQLGRFLEHLKRPTLVDVRPGTEESRSRRANERAGRAPTSSGRRRRALRSPRPSSARPSSRSLGDDAVPDCPPRRGTIPYRNAPRPVRARRENCPRPRRRPRRRLRPTPGRRSDGAARRLRSGRPESGGGSGPGRLTEVPLSDATRRRNRPRAFAGLFHSPPCAITIRLRGCARARRSSSLSR